MSAAQHLRRFTSSARLPLVGLALVLLATACDQSGGNNTDAQAGASDAAYSLAVIPKGTTHIFWQSVEAGAREAAQEHNVAIQWKGPLKESDRVSQKQIVDQFVAQGVDGIVLAPLDSKALSGPVQDARRADIPVVIFDSALEGKAGEDYISFVATDNHAGGKLGGEHVVGLLGGSGQVTMLRYQLGSASTEAREAGFLEAIEAADNVRILKENVHGGATAGEAKTKALNMLDAVRSADAIFTPNESTTYGMLLALRQAGIAGEKTFVGFDASPPLVKALESGEIDALVVQNPKKMGHTAVKTMAQHLRGEDVPARIDTGVALVTKENMNDPEIKPLLP